MCDENDKASSTIIDTHDDRYVPTGGPIAEPSMFDYDKSIDNEVPSKRRLEAFFPERDIEKRVNFGDTYTELGLLEMFFFWVADIANDPKGHRNWRFYIELYQELHYDFKQLTAEYNDTCMMAPSMGQWEFEYLDQNEKTERIEPDLEKALISSQSTSMHALMHGGSTTNLLPKVISQIF